MCPNLPPHRRDNKTASTVEFISFSENVSISTEALISAACMATLISLDWIQTCITHTTQTSDEYPPQTNNPTPCGPHKAQGDFTFSFRYMPQHSHWGFGRWQETRVIIDDVVSKLCSSYVVTPDTAHRIEGHLSLWGILSQRALWWKYISQCRKTCSNIASTTAHLFVHIPNVT